MALKRFGVSLEDDLFNKLDKFVSDNQFPNRSQAIRFLIEENAVEKEWEDNKEVAGVIVLQFDHHKKGISKKATNIQHNYHGLVIASQHVHLDHDNCLETIIVRGKASQLKELSDELIALKGVKHGKLVMTKTK